MSIKGLLHNRFLNQQVKNEISRHLNEVEDMQRNVQAAKDLLASFNELMDTNRETMIALGIHAATDIVPALIRLMKEPRTMEIPMSLLEEAVEQGEESVMFMDGEEGVSIFEPEAETEADETD